MIRITAASLYVSWQIRDTYNDSGMIGITIQPESGAVIHAATQAASPALALPP